MCVCVCVRANQKRMLFVFYLADCACTAYLTLPHFCLVMSEMGASMYS